MQSTLPRKIRLVTGMVLFAYVAGHLVNLALGLHSLQLMDEWLPVFQAPWQNPVGVVVLYASLILHMMFGLQSLYARRTLRMTRFDAVQLAMALILPPLLVIHILGTRVAFTLTGFLPSYAWLMLIYWQWQPLMGLRQVLVVMVVWVHGCMSLYYWLRLQPWWVRCRGFVYPLAFLVPVASLLGFVEAGKDALALASDEAWLAELRGRATMLDEAALEGLYRAQSVFLQAYTALVVGVLLARAWRLRREDATEEVQVSYAGGPTVRAAAGLSLLEVSRVAEVAHASLCGGRGRCGTCRVRVLDGASYLAPPSPLEAATLARLGAPGDVRLACQSVPHGSPLTLARLVPTEAAVDALEPVAAGDGQREAVILLAEFDGIDALAEGRADHDTLFHVGRYLDLVSRAVEAAGGRLVRVDADGVRAVFGLDEPLADGARRALGAVRSMNEGVSALAREHEREGIAGLGLSVSVQAGRVLFGDVEVADVSRLALAGEAVDLAARAQRELGGEQARLLLAETVARLGGVRTQDLPVASIDVGGEPASVLLVHEIGDLAFDASPVAAS